MEDKMKDTENKIKKILIAKGIKRAGIFGSYARNEQKKNSDIDILIETPNNFSLFDFVGLKQELEKVLKKKVDLVDYRIIKERLKERILNEERIII